MTDQKLKDVNSNPDEITNTWGKVAGLIALATAAESGFIHYFSTKSGYEIALSVVINTQV